jgi:hypothetical protein
VSVESVQISQQHAAGRRAACLGETLAKWALWR